MVSPHPAPRDPGPLPGAPPLPWGPHCLSPLPLPTGMAVMLRPHLSRLAGRLHVLAPDTHPTCALAHPGSPGHGPESLPLATPAPSVLPWRARGSRGPDPGLPQGPWPCSWGKEDVQGVSTVTPHPMPPICCPQALAFPDQLYDAVFDGAQVTSKTPIRLYGGALLSEYCWGGLRGR